MIGIGDERDLQPREDRDNKDWRRTVLLLAIIGSLAILIGIVASSASEPEVQMQTGMMNQAKSFDEMTSDEKAEFVMQKKINSANLVASDTTLDLNDDDLVNKLQTEGLVMTIDQSLHMKVVENPSTGYMWIKDNECADDYIQISDQFVNSGMDDINSVKPSGLSERGNRRVGAPGMRLFSLQAVSQGSCTFRIAHARGWMFEWGNPLKQESLAKIEIPIQII